MLVTQQNPKLGVVLPKLLDDPAVRIGAIRAYGTLNDDGASELFFSRYSKWEPAAKRAAVETLATRKEYATKLLAALKEERIPKEDIPAHVARPLSDMLGSAFTDVFGDLDELSKDKAALIAKYTKLLTPGNLAKADPAKGRLVFAASCTACHQLYGEGGILGPDLTGSNRADLSYILLNMIEPSADIPEAYQLVTVHTKDGQVLGGMVKQEDDQRVVLNMVGQSTTVLKSDIEKREISPMSMMPEGLLTTLQDKQVLDLVKYLQTTEQVDLPK
jgi:putative heme-binding domain-containing protein